MKCDRSRLPLAIAAAFLLVLGLTTACGTGPSEPRVETNPPANSGQVATATLENLQAAYDSENNTAARYLAFAKKADSQGYPKAASLFRAAARAEEIHARNHAEVIRSMGAEPKTELKTPEVGSTAENLWKSIQGESQERDEMYPAYIRQARDAHNTAAVHTLRLARSAETGHALLYQAALEALKDKTSAATTYYVCPGCGFTRTGTAGMPACPACGTEMDKFIVVK